MSVALATKGVICTGGSFQGGVVYYYYCVDLPGVVGSRDVSPKLTAQSIGVKIVMDDLGSHFFVDNLSAEEYIEDLIPKLTIK